MSKEFDIDFGWFANYPGIKTAVDMMRAIRHLIMQEPYILSDAANSMRQKLCDCSTIVVDMDKPTQIVYSGYDPDRVGAHEIKTYLMNENGMVKDMMTLYVERNNKLRYWTPGATDLDILRH